jgi:hypothetical protein
MHILKLPKLNPVETCVRGIIEIELKFQGILWAFWNASRLGLLIRDAERTNGNTNIRFNRIMQRSSMMVRSKTGWEPMLCYIVFWTVDDILESYRRAPALTTRRRKVA